MDFEKEVKYRLARWILANLRQKEKITEETYHQLLDRLLDKCDPPLRSIEERLSCNE